MRRFGPGTLFFDPAAQPLTELSSSERLVSQTADSLCGAGEGEGPGRYAHRCFG